MHPIRSLYFLSLINRIVIPNTSPTSEIALFNLINASKLIKMPNQKP